MSHELLQGLFLKDCAVIGHHEGNWLLALARIGPAHDRCFLHARKLVEDLLDLARIDVDAVDQQHVLFAVGDEVIAFVIAVADVAGQEPAVAHDFGRFSRLLPVAEHHVAAAHAQLADFVRPQLASGIVLDAYGYVRDGQADRACFARMVERVFGHHRAGFAQSVTLDERNVEPGLELLEDLGGQRRGTADTDPQGQGDVNRRIDHAPVKLGDGGQDGGLAF